jgi:hypothetical protein
MHTKGTFRPSALSLRASVLLVAIAIVLATGCASAPRLEHPDRLVVVTVADTGGARMPARGYHEPGYRISATAAAAIAGLQRDYGLTKVDGWPIELLGVYCAVFSIDGTPTLADALARIGRDPRVKLAQPMQSFAVHGYNDPYFNLQYGASSAQVVEMHQGATGRGVRVAVVDTGVDRAHPDLKGRIGQARNFVAGDPHFDTDIHGTAVAGIIAANADNGVGIVGLAPAADLLALKACWQPKPDDIGAQCNTFTLAKALTYAIEQRADVINMSLGGPNDPLLTLLLEVALARGALVVAAQNAPDDFPADLPGVIAVRAANSASAPRREGNVVEVAAHDLLSTSPGGRYDYFSGSSMGAARVAGISALLREQRIGASVPELLDALTTRLAALGAVEPDTRVVTHAPETPPSALPLPLDVRPKLIPARHNQGS